jgi:hypothetical protein
VREYSYLTIHGQVKNISSEKLEGVWVVVEFYDANGTLVTSHDGVIEYSPIMPGQTSPFTVMERDNPLIKNFEVHFKHTFGGLIPHKDSRPDPSPPKKKK